MSKFIEAWDTRTGAKLPNRVPESWITNAIFDYLSATPTEPADTPAEEVTPETDEADIRPAGKHAASESLKAK